MRKFCVKGGSYTFLLLCLLLLLPLMTVWQAEALPRHCERAEVRRIIDGDTFVVSIYCRGFEKLSPLVIRIRNVDTPELYGRCLAERLVAKAARNKLQQFLPIGSIVKLYELSYEWKNSKRLLAQVTNHEGLDVRRLLLGSGYALSWPPRRKEKWCALYDQNND